MRKLSLLLALMIMGITGLVYADGDTIVVRPSEMGGWVFIDEGASGSTGEFVLGPGTPPAGAAAQSSY